MHIKNKIKDLAQGVGDVVGGVVKFPKDIRYIQSKNEEIEKILEETNKKIEPIREETNYKLEQLGKVRVKIIETTVAEFTEQMSRIKNLPFDSERGKGSMKSDSFTFSKKEFESMRVSVVSLKELLTKSTGAVGGAAAGAGAIYSAVAAFGATSTGAFMSTLSGAVTSNATLAWLSGSVLSVGSGGVAIGASVLGGIALVPAVSYLFWKRKFSYAKERAEVDARFEEAIEYAKSVQKIKQNFTELIRLIDNTIFLTNRYARAVNQLNKQTDHIISIVGDDYEKYSDRQQFLIQKHIVYTSELISLIKKPIMNKDGSLNQEMLELLHTLNKILEDFGEIEFVDFTKKKGESAWGSYAAFGSVLVILGVLAYAIYPYVIKP